MGIFGRLTGWDQQKDAHNAVLASYLSETASRELRIEIAKRIVLIQQQMRPTMAGDPQSILADLSNRSRIVQMNFVALACNSLGIPPGLGGLQFQTVENPYRAEDESSLNRINVAIDDLSRRCGRRLSWPGNQERVDFRQWGEFAKSTHSGGMGKGVDPNRAAELASVDLLAEIVPLAALTEVARELEKIIGANSDHELALATALFFFEQPDFKDDLSSVQMMARLTMVQWLQEGCVEAAVAKHFEGQLYALYKP